MTIASFIISAVALVFSIAVLVYSMKVAMVYHRFNEQIKDWAQSIDDTMRDAIDLSARNILREIDDRITRAKESENEENNEENIENENEE